MRYASIEYLQDLEDIMPVSAIKCPEILDGVYIDTETHADADTLTEVSHTLGRVPEGFIVIGKNKAGDVYNDTESHTETDLRIKSNVSSLSVRLYVW